MADNAPTEAVADRLHSAAIHLLRLLREEDLSLGLGPTQLSALSVLVFGEPQTIGALARIEQVRLPTISRVADALVQAGLAEREVDAQDRRVVRLRASAAGTRLMQKGRRQRVQRLVRLLEELSAGELETMGAAAERLARLLRRPRSG